MNQTRKKSALLAILMSTFAVLGQAQAAPIAYPAKGQSPQQQQKDDGECFAWAKSTTGIDPAAVTATPAPTPQSGPAVGGGERATGAVRGAVVGGIIDGGDGAAKGAAVGVVAGGVRARQNQKTQEAQAQSQAQAQKQGAINTFYRAHSACMEGRGYAIK
jgi:hypothetical protein